MVAELLEGLLKTEAEERVELREALRCRWFEGLEEGGEWDLAG